MNDMSKQWLEKANADLKTIVKIIDDEYLTNIVAFHAQQCAEKCFKAILEEKKIKVPKTHDLIALYKLIKAEADFLLNDDILDTLSKVYLESRYPFSIGLLPHGNPTQKEAKEFYDFADNIFSEVQRVIK